MSPNESSAPLHPSRLYPSRRGLLRTGAASAAGVLGAAIVSRSTSAATGDELILGQDNTADAPTRISFDGDFDDINGPGPISLELNSPGGHLRLIGTIGDHAFGTYPDGTLVYNATSGLEIWLIDGAGGVHPTLLARPGTAGAFSLLPTPQRAYDSRTDARLATGETRTVDLLADTEAIPENIDGVMVNLTVTDTAGWGFLTVYSAALATVPETSNINWSATGATIANQVVSATEFARLKVSCGGGGSTHFIVDVIGTYGGG